MLYRVPILRDFSDSTEPAFLVVNREKTTGKEGLSSGGKSKPCEMVREAVNRRDVCPELPFVTDYNEIVVLSGQIPSLDEVAEGLTEAEKGAA